MCVEKIMRCVRTVLFSILINGESKGLIKSSRGLRQSDHLSPYLFLICTKGLIALLARAAAEKKITGVQISQGAPIINHLLFANNSILFCKVEMREKQHILNLLEKYEHASGQQINRAKTSMSFSKNMKEDTRQKIMEFWGLTVVEEHTRYLGLPPLVGQAKMRAFFDIKCKVLHILRGWKEKLMSQGRKKN